MLTILVLCPALLASAVLTLTIDSQLGTSIEDCFERISIGDQLPLESVYRNVSELMIKECEQICKQDKQCQAFDYGVGAKGNATCDLSNIDDKEIKEKKLLKRSPDYDVYVRRILCEQSPPTPIENQFDDHDKGPQHRPVYRPEEEERRPFDDLNPYESNRPLPSYSNRPNNNYNAVNEKPDEYGPARPDSEISPSYGGHMLQEPYRPNKRYNNSRPDPYDVLYFQDSRRPRPDFSRPDPYHPVVPDDEIGDIYGQKPSRPQKPQYLPEKPQYQYFIRPNKRPNKPNDQGYQSNQEYPTRPDPYEPSPEPVGPLETPYRPTLPDQYRPNPEPSRPVVPLETPYRPTRLHPYRPISQPSRPIGPPETSYRPTRPYDKPSYTYTDQYASNYGTSQDNSIHVEIYDPPRPYIPNLTEKPYYGTNYGTSSQSYGQNSYSSQHSYSQSQAQYGSGSWNSQHQYDLKPEKPSSNGYRPENIDSGYGARPTTKPRPSENSQSSYNQYSQTSNQGYGDNHLSNSYSNQDSVNNQGYGSQNSNNQASNGYGNPSPPPSPENQYGNTQNGYGNQGPSRYGQVDKTQSSGYGQTSYGQEQSTSQYGISQSGNHVDYKPRPNPSGYGNQPSTSKPISTSGYGQNEQTAISYGTPSTSQGSQSNQYGSSQTQISNHYGNSQSAYGSQDLGSYGQSYGQSGYYGSHLGYGIHHLYGIKPGSYGTSDVQPSDIPNNDGYGKKEAKPANKPEYNNLYDKPNRRPGYSDRPAYKPHETERERPGYMLRPNDEIVTSKPVAVADPGKRPEHEFNYKACFRRVLAGRRALRSHVRRVVDCEQLEDCRRECATEKRFPCESFNYRLDSTLRGKGLCELMTKPIEAFDIHQDFVEDKDYDFYEVDRNSLEPYCPTTLRGPGLLHSGFLSSKPDKAPPQTQWRDRNWSANDYKSYNRFYNEKKSQSSNRRFEDQLYVPYQIGVSRSSEDKESWGKYGGSYGSVDSYYKDRDDYHKSINHWGLQKHGVEYHKNFNDNSFRRDHEQEFNYNNLRRHGDESLTYGYGGWKKGRWNNSGSFWKDDTITKFESDDVDDNIKDRTMRCRHRDCSSRRRAGMSLGAGAVRRSLRARSVLDCEAACFGEKEFKCVSYSYRYSSSSSSDNCYLSERPYKGLDMSTDSGSDVYAMPLHHDCLTISTKPWVESECFWHVRSGAAVSAPSIRASLSVAGLGACEAECIRAHGFFCRGFSFRFDAPTIGDDVENCLLTSSPPTTLELSNGLQPNKHELYARGNYGRGCEPALYDDGHHEPQCYLQQAHSSRLSPGSVRGRAHCSDQRACARACDQAPFICLSFSYTNNAPPNSDNCLLSAIRLFDLQRGVDYEHSADDLLFAFDLFNGQCWRKVHGKNEYEIPTLEVPHPLQVDETYHAHPPSETYIPSSGPSGPPGIKPYISDPEYKPGFIPGPVKPYLESGEIPSGYNSFEYSEPGYKPYYTPSKPDYVPNKPIITHSYRPSYGPSDSTYDPSRPTFGPSVSSYDSSGSVYGSGISQSSGSSFSQSSGSTYGSTSNLALGSSSDSSYGGYVSHGGSSIGSSSHDGSIHEGSSSSGSIYGLTSGSSSGSAYGSTGGSSSGSVYGSPDGSNYGSSGGPTYGSLGSSDYISSVGSTYGSSASSAYGSSAGSAYGSSGGSAYGSSGGSAYGSSGGSAYGSSGGSAYGSSGGSAYGSSGGSTHGSSGSSIYESSGGSNYGQATRPHHGQGSYRPDRPIGDRVDENLSQSWRHYTVSGLPCRRGTVCARNHVAGHWACETEGGEIGSWDYCCAPTHRCGYSEGFRKPWCYVGAAGEQWRPCSEKYYPYHQHDAPHPSQGFPEGERLHSHKPPNKQTYVERDKLSSGYLSPADRRYWDDLYKNGPQAYYDKYGNPLPGFTRVPTENRPYIKYERNPPRAGSGHWVPVATLPDNELPPAGLGVPRYWPVAYLHKGPPPNMTYFKYNETERTTRSPQQQRTTTDKATANGIEGRSEDSPRSEKRINITNENSIVTTTIKAMINETAANTTEKDTRNSTEDKEYRLISKVEDDYIKGIDGKLHDFTKSLEIFDIEDVKSDKLANLRTPEAEEKQIEAIGRLLAARRGSKILIEKRAEKNLENKNIAFDKDFIDFNFGNKFPIERRGVIQKVSKDDIEISKDKSLEVSETTFVRRPRVLNTTDNIRKAVINGKVFYDATIRDQRDLFSNSSRRSKNQRLEDRGPSVISSGNSRKKNDRTRNTNPIRRVKRVYRKRYNPEEVRKRLLEREKSKTSTN